MTDATFSEPGEHPEESELSPDSLVGRVVSGRYRIEAELGTGGMGAVYRAEHTLMRKRLAIKVLHPEMTRLPEVVARFEREAMAAAHIEHPNVAAATDFGKLDDGSFFLVLEYVEGQSLRDLLDGGSLEPSRVLHIGKQIAGALVRAHGLGIVHRDLKPENVMLVTRDGDSDFVKVLDFGIAKVPVAEITKETGKQHKTLTQLGMVYGTPEYMAPEQALGQEVDARADLYALGVMLYEMLAGRRPFESDNPVSLLGMQVTQPPPPFVKSAPGLPIPAEFEALVMELLEKEAERRPTEAKQVLDALEQLRPFIADPSLWGMRTGQQPVASAATEIRWVGEPSAGVRPSQNSEGLSDFAHRVSRGIESVHRVVRPSYVQGLTDSLREKLPSPVRSIPLTGWLAGAGGVGAVLVAAGAGLLCWATIPRTAESAFGEQHWAPPAVSAAVAQASKQASPAEIDAAVAKGGASVEALFEKYPNDPQVAELLAKTKIATDPAQGAKVFSRLFLLDAGAARRPAVQRAILEAAGKKEGEDAAFGLMMRDMGEAGADLLYAIGHEKKSGSKSAIARAVRTLGERAVREKASPALRIALDMRAATGCDKKYKLLDRAKDDGDHRTLVQLRGLFSQSGCGFMGFRDCWPCMRRGSNLSDAVKAISEREKQDSGG